MAQIRSGPSPRYVCCLWPQSRPPSERCDILQANLALNLVVKVAQLYHFLIVLRVMRVFRLFSRVRRFDVILSTFVEVLPVVATSASFLWVLYGHCTHYTKHLAPYARLWNRSNGVLGR